MITTRTYLDYNATAPLLPEARAAMIAALEQFGNPSSVHAEGRAARAIIEAARIAVAALVKAKPSEVIFTSGATEANAWVMGAGWTRIYLADIEHDSIDVPAARSSAERVVLPVDGNGIVPVESVAAVLADAAAARRSLLTLQTANNETGVIQPVADVAALAHEHGIAVHTDAVQAAGRIDLDFRSLGVTTMSISAHKLGGPKGVGALIVREGTDLKAMIAGGGQEHRRRGGTENVAAIAGFGAAAVVVRNRMADWSRVCDLRNELEREILAVTPNAVIAGAGAPRIPNTSSVAVAGRVAETSVIKFDLAGVAVSAGAACSSGKVGASRALRAMGFSEELARSAVRLSLGRDTTRDDIDALLGAWRKIMVAPAMAA